MKLSCSKFHWLSCLILQLITAHLKVSYLGSYLTLNFLSIYCTWRQHGRFDMLLSPISDILADISCMYHIMSLVEPNYERKRKKKDKIMIGFLKKNPWWFGLCLMWVAFICILHNKIVSGEAEWSSTKSCFRVHTTRTIKNHMFIQ